MAHFNIIDRIYFAGERLHDRGNWKIDGPSAIVYVLLFPLCSLLDKLHDQNLLPFNNKFSFLYVFVGYAGLYFCIWAVYVKTGRHVRVMNYYRSRAIDAAGCHYFYLICGVVVGLVIAVVINKYGFSFPPKWLL